MGLRILTPVATKITALEKNDASNAGAILGSIAFDIENGSRRNHVEVYPVLWRHFPQVSPIFSFVGTTTRSLPSPFCSLLILAIIIPNELSHKASMFC